MEMEIKALTKELTEDFIDFFDNTAFCDNPDWAGCYCCFFYFSDDVQWLSRKVTQNKALAETLIEEGKLNGFLAYVDKKPVGWCNADDIQRYSRIMDDQRIPKSPDIKVGAIVCFVVDHQLRNKGIATALLEAAYRHFEEMGYDAVEAYPRMSPESPAENYHGPLGMYEKHGFEMTCSNEEFSVVSKKLK